MACTVKRPTAMRRSSGRRRTKPAAAPRRGASPGCHRARGSGGGTPCRRGSRLPRARAHGGRRGSAGAQEDQGLPAIVTPFIHSSGSDRARPTFRSRIPPSIHSNVKRSASLARASQSRSPSPLNSLESERRMPRIFLEARAVAEDQRRTFRMSSFAERASFTRPRLMSSSASRSARCHSSVQT